MKLRLPLWLQRKEYYLTGLGVFNVVSAGPWYTEMEAHEYARDHQPYNINGYTLSTNKNDMPRIFGIGSNPARTDSGT